MTFTISPAIKQCWPETALGLLLYQVQVAPSSPQLLAQFDQTVASLAQQYTLDTIAKHPHIAATRPGLQGPGASPTNTGTRGGHAPAGGEAGGASTTSTMWWR